jgi:hypothetical protein
MAFLEARFRGFHRSTFWDVSASVNWHILDLKAFDPFVGIDLHGITSAFMLVVPDASVTVGCNYWFTDAIGLRLSVRPYLLYSIAAAGVCGDVTLSAFYAF